MTKTQAVSPEERKRPFKSRPSRVGALPRNHRITSAVTEEDENRMRAVAAASGMKLSDWMRNALLEAVTASEDASRGVESGDNASK